MRWMLTLRLGALACMAAAGAGCQLDPQAAPGTSTAAADRSVIANGAWPYWPTRMRIHPATRITTDAASGTRTIEARVQFFDADGYVSRAVGRMIVQLQASHADPPEAEPVQTWNMNLADPAANRRQYDDITLTYLLRLQIEPAALGDESELRVFFLSTNGRQLEARMRLSRR